MKYALFNPVVNSEGKFTVHEINEAPRVIDGIEFSLTQMWHPQFVLNMRPCGDDVAVGDLYDPVTLEYSKPAPAPAPEAMETDTGNGNPPPN